MALPFENNTDRVIKRLARASLESERRRNLLAGLIVFGAAFLLSFAAILAGNATLALEVSEGVTSDRELATVLFGVALVGCCWQRGLRSATSCISRCSGVRGNLRSCAPSARRADKYGASPPSSAGA